VIENEIELTINNVLYEFKSLSFMCIDYIDKSKLRVVSDLSWIQKDILGKLGFKYTLEYINFADSYVNS
jgi:hypothetical protein